MRRQFILVFTLLLILTLYYSPVVEGNSLFKYEWVRETTVYAPAVAGSEYGPGVLIKIDVVVAYPGSGRVFFQAQPLTQIDTQATARVAAVVAADIAGVDFYDYDYYITMTSESIVVGGPSAGAIMTIAILSLLLNHALRSNVTMTGMVNPDGTVGPVGGLKSKLEAAAMNGFKVFLIPYGQRIVMVPNETITKYPWGIVKRVEYTQLDLVKYGEKLGVKVIEVSSIREAYKYFTGYNITYKTPVINPSLPKWFKDVLSSVAEDFTDESRSRIEYVRSLLDRINPFYRGAIYGMVVNAEKTINETMSLLKSGRIVLAANKAYESLYEATYCYWLARVLVNTSDIEFLVEKANTTLNNISLEIRGYMGRNTSLSRLDVMVAIASRYSDAILHYRNGVNALSKNDVGSAVRELSYSLSRAESVVAWLKVMHYCSGDRIIDLDKVYAVTILLYGLAKNIVSYAYSLSHDIGSTPSELNEALQHMNRASMFINKKNSTIVALGEIVNALAYSIASIHDMFSVNKQSLNVLALKIREEAVLSYSMLEAENLSVVLPAYYIVYGDELYGLRESMNAIIVYILASIHAKVLGYCSNIKTTILVEHGSREATTTITKNTTTPQQATTPRKYTAIESLYYTLIGLFAGILLGSLTTYILTTKKR